MANEQVIAFLRSLKDNPGERKKLAGASTADLVAAAKKQGHNISEADLNAVIASRRNEKPGAADFRLSWS